MRTIIKKHSKLSSTHKKIDISILEPDSILDPVEASKLKKISSLLTGCESCVSVLENQAKDEIIKLLDGKENLGGRFFIKKRKGENKIYVEIFEKNI